MHGVVCLIPSDCIEYVMGTYSVCFGYGVYFPYFKMSDNASLDCVMMPH